MCFRGLNDSLSAMDNVSHTRASPEPSPTATLASSTRTVRHAPSHEDSREHDDSISTSSSSSRRSSFSSSHDSVWTPARSVHSSPNTSFSSTSSVASSAAFYTSQDIHNALARIAHMYDQGEIYGTYDLGNGRRGAISGPSSDHYDGDYDERSDEEQEDEVC